MSKMLFHFALESYIYALQVLVIFKDFYLKLLVLRASVCVVVLNILYAVDSVSPGALLYFVSTTSA